MLELRALLRNQEWMQIFAILIAAFVGFNSALLYAWPSPSIPILLSADFPSNVTLEEASYTTVIPSIASVLSSPLYPYLMNKYGRKPTLLSVALPQFLSWLLVSQAEDIYVIYAARFLSGFSNACVYGTLPVYIGEVSSPRVRGLWGNAMSCLVYFGLCVMNIVGTVFSMKTSAYIFGCLPVLFFVLFLGMPESPYFHLRNGDLKKAREQLVALRRDGAVEKEFEEMRSGVERQLGEPSSFLDLFRVRDNLKALGIAVAVRGAQQFAGISALAVYSQIIFSKSAGNISAGTSAVLYSAALTLFCCTGSCCLDTIGRRRAMIASCCGCSLILFFLALYFYLQADLNLDARMPFFPLIGMLLYVPLYCMGLGIVPNLMLGELFSSSIKGSALCILNITFAVYSSISTKVFQLLYSLYGMYAPFLLFSICCVVSAIFSYFCIPETAGKTLEEIQLDLKQQQKTRL